MRWIGCSNGRSTYMEGTTCPLAKHGHNRDGKRGKLQVNYGLLTNRDGCPVSVSVYAGNTGDPKTVTPQIRKVKDEFGIKNLVLVGDRGMIGQKLIDHLREHEPLETCALGGWRSVQQHRCGRV